MTKPIYILLVLKYFNTSPLDDTYACPRLRLLLRSSPSSFTRLHISKKKKPSNACQ